MSRGLTDTPEPENNSQQLQEMDQAIEEIFSMLSVLFAKVDTLEKIMGQAIELPKEQSNRLKGL